MAITSIADHAESCLDREYLLRWFPDGIQFQGSQLGFSDTELAIVEETLRSLDQGQSLLIHNPLPGNRIPIAICLAYARTQDPRFPTQGIVGEGHSLLAFPAMNKGYLSTIDDTKLDGIGKRSTLVNREPIDSLTESSGSADIYTAKHGIEFDHEYPARDIGAVFIDLRKPEWGKFGRRFSEIYDLNERTDIPFIFYTDEISDEAATLQEQLDTIEVTSKLLMTAKGMSVPNPGKTAQFGHLLSEENFSVEYIPVGFPEMKAVVKDLVQMKDDLQKRGIANIEVGWLFNLLTKLPIRPEHWNDVTDTNYYQQGVNDLIETLKSKSSRYDGRASGLLINYCHAADRLHGLLNRKHPVQEELFALIEEAEKNDIDRVFVLRNDSEREAVLRAITIDGGPSFSSAAIRELANVDAGEFDEVVICRPLDYDSYVYEFPLAPEMKFLQFESWAEVVKRRVDRGLDVLGADTKVRRVGRFVSDKETKDKPTAASVEGRQPTQATDEAQETPEPANRDIKEPSFAVDESVDNYVPDVEGASEEEVIETLEDEFKQSTSPTEAGTHGSGETPSLKIELENGNVRTTSEHARVTILRENGDVGRIQASDLSVGDTVVLVDSAAEDIYDMFLESAHEKEKIRKCESVVERWRNTLKDGLEEMPAQEFLERIQDRGSQITDPQTIELWADGSAIGPKDPEDVRRVLDVLDPEMKPTWEATVQAMKDIRVEHRQIGKQARDAIESKMSSSMVGELSESLNEGFDRSEVTRTDVKEIVPLQ